MQKGCVLKLLSVVALLILARAMDAAPIASEVPDLQQTSLKGDQKTDPWKSGPDIHDTTFDRQEMTTPVRPSGSLDKATSSPHYLDKLLAAAKTQSQTLMVPSVPVDSDGLENILSAVKRLDVQLKQVSVMDDPESEEPMEESSVHKPVKQTLVTVNSNKQRKTVLEAKGASVNKTPDRREKILYMLSALEKLHRSLNSTLNSRVTIITRGNSNSRSPGKKNKMITDGNMKSTTVSNVVSKGASPRSSTDQTDPKLLSGKAFKKSLPLTPKKTNKRVCFWKYCSQN